MATLSSILAWKIPWIEEPGGLQSLGSQRVGHDLTMKRQQQVFVMTLFLGVRDQGMDYLGDLVGSFS